MAIAARRIHKALVDTVLVLAQAFCGRVEGATGAHLHAPAADAHGRILWFMAKEVVVNRILAGLMMLDDEQRVCESTRQTMSGRGKNEKNSHIMLIPKG